MAKLQQFVGSLTDASVFEVASGTGWWTRLLAARNRVIASDYAPEMLDEARQRTRIICRSAAAGPTPTGCPPAMTPWMPACSGSG